MSPDETALTNLAVEMQLNNPRNAFLEKTMSKKMPIEEALRLSRERYPQLRLESWFADWLQLWRDVGFYRAVDHLNLVLK